MAKKIYLSPSNQNANTYKTGNTNEMEQCNKIAEKVEVGLKREGFDVKKATKGQAMSKSISESNSWGSDLHIPIHTNAFNGSITGGTMVMLYSITGNNQKAGEAILNAVAPVSPGSDYALQARPDLAELNQTTAIAVYIEVEFHDTVEGATFIINNTEKIAEAIVLGICNYYGVKYTGGSDNSGSETTKELYRVRKEWSDAKSQIGAFSVLNNAKRQADEYAAQGYKVFDSSGKVVYTPSASVVDNTEKLINNVVSFAKSHIGQTGEVFLKWFYGYLNYVDWCAIFNSYVHNQAGTLNRCVPSTAGAGTVARLGVANKMGHFYLKNQGTIKAGDSLLFRYGGRTYTDQYHSDHIEIVTDVSGSTISTVGGNIGSNHSTSVVASRTHKLSDSIVYGYYRPNYSLVTGTVTDPPAVATGDADIRKAQEWVNITYNTKIAVDGIMGAETLSAYTGALQVQLNKDYSAGLTVDGIYGAKTKNAIKNLSKGSKGNYVNILQGMLICRGYAAGTIDGIFGTNTYNAVISLQKKNSLTADGIAGKDTFTVLFKN